MQLGGGMLIPKKMWTLVGHYFSEISRRKQNLCDSKRLAPGYAFVGRIVSWPYRIMVFVSRNKTKTKETRNERCKITRVPEVFGGCGYCYTYLSRISTVKYVNCLGKVAGNPEALRTCAPAEIPPPLFVVGPKRVRYDERIQYKYSNRSGTEHGRGRKCRVRQGDHNAFPWVIILLWGYGLKWTSVTKATAKAMALLLV